MPSQVNLLKVFVASPSDIKDERVILEEVIDDINKVFNTRNGLGFELIKWETDTHPGVGEDAQSVINNQIGDNYDVFIGLLWTRIGTPTKREASGTIEEIMRAYQRAKDKPESIRLMIYFRTSPISPDEINGEQISKVQEFKRSIGDLGVYWWPYNTVRDFERHVRLHLQNALLDFGNKWGTRDHEIDLINNVNKDVSEVRDDLLLKRNLGTEADILRLSGFIENAFDLANASVIRIQNSIQLFGNKTREQTNKLEEIRHDPKRQEKALANLDSYSHDIDNFVTEIEALLPELSKNFRSGIDYFVELISSERAITGRLDRQTKLKIFKSLNEMKSSGIEAQNSFNYSRTVNQHLPDQPLRLKQSKAHLLGVLDNLQDEFQTQVSLVTEAIKVSESTFGWA